MTSQGGEAGSLSAGRLKAPVSDTYLALAEVPHLEREKRHFHHFITVDLAHSVMLAEQGVLSPDHAARILETLLEIARLGPDGFPIDPRRGSFLLQVEAFLVDRIGEDVGGRMHTGRSRLDQGPAARRLYKRDRLLDVIERLIALQEVILAVASRHIDTIMPGYTCLQHAQPANFGHYLLAFFEKLHDDFDRLAAAYRRVNLNPLGAAGLSGTSWPLDRARTSELLGFGGLVENAKLAREAYYAAEAIAALSFVMSSLNDLATDLHIWSSFEFGLVETADEFCGTSSIFPQKKNPAALEAIKFSAGEAITWLATALGTFRSEGTGDVVMRELPLIDGAFRATTGSLELMAGVLSTLTVNRERMLRIVVENWSTASNLADELVRLAGLSYRQAHHVVGRLVRNAIERGIKPYDVTGAMLDAAGLETAGRPIGFDTAQVRAALDPVRFAETRVTRGSINPREIRRMMERGRGILEGEASWLAGERQAIAASMRKLDDAVAFWTGRTAAPREVAATGT